MDFQSVHSALQVPLHHCVRILILLPHGKPNSYHAAAASFFETVAMVLQHNCGATVCAFQASTRRGDMVHATPSCSVH